MARFDLALLIILIFHDRNRFFNHQSRRTHLIHSVDERGPPSKGCIRNGIISPPPLKREKYFFRATFHGSREQSRERDADNNLGVAGRFVPGARRETARLVCA